jgi:methylthioribose-1-phosphate isomerase
LSPSEPDLPPAPEPAPGFDIGRRRFFRQLAGDAVQVAATVVGAAGMLQRTSAVLLEPPKPAEPVAFDHVTGKLLRPAVFRTPFRLEDEALILIDQRKLPDDVIEYGCTTAGDVAEAIQKRIVRGTPAIGQVAALGMALAAHRMVAAGPLARRAALLAAASAMTNARPSSITVRRAVDRMLARYDAIGDPSEEGGAVASALRLEADAIVLEATNAHERIAELGLAELPVPVDRPLQILTLGNSGVLAGGLVGVALGVVTAAAAAGREVRVLVCETRPLLQGVRLTGWELGNAGIPMTIIVDSAAGSHLAAGEVDVVLAAADRIAANGDLVGVIGTYPLAVLAARHGIPFVVCAPLVTFDPGSAGGDDLPVDRRAAADQVLPGPTGLTRRAADPFGDVTPVGDVTPAELVSAIVTEEGVLRAPHGPALAAAVERAAERVPTDPAPTNSHRPKAQAVG